MSRRLVALAGHPVTNPVYHGSGLFRDFVRGFTKTYCLGVTHTLQLLRAMEGLTPERSR